MNSKSRLALLISLALMLATAAYAQDQGREFHWSGKLAPDKVVEIKNVNGSIEAEAASGDEIQITAEKIGPRADEVKIEVVPSSEGVTICTIYPDGALGGSSGTCEPGKHWHTHNVHGDRVQVRFHARIPKNLRFTGISVNGNVSAEDMSRFVYAESVNGSIHVSTTSWAEMQTVNGSIKGRMGNAAWTGTLKVESVNGSIDLEMPDDLSANVDFKSVNGRITSDFPVTVSGGFVGHSAHGQIGSGGRDLEIKTVNGSVTLKKAGGI
ncbi:MAG TPA: DUF4097 family beta strand repeat-containing protein [Terriglobales bacterium]|nr:DUF4097 family beta strand repeat-containing protein [Terriglobales bacterium]